MKEQGRILLADRILAGCKLIGEPGSAGPVVCKTIRDSISECEIIEVSEVARFFCEHHLYTEKCPFEIFPNIAPPFPKFFIEMQAHPNTSLDLAGVFFSAVKMPYREAELQSRNSAAGQRGMRFEWVPGVCNSEEDVWFSHAIGIGYSKLNGGAAIPLFYYTAIISLRGQIATRYNPVFSLAGPLMTEKALDGFTGHVLNPALFALSFLHCKNIRVKSNEPPAALSKAHQRRHGRPLLRYHTLEIEPMKKVLETEGGLSHNGLKKALHICRGHFATYTPEKGMLGRKLDAPVTVWKPAHVRGNASEGIVAKDYKIKAPKASQ